MSNQELWVNTTDQYKLFVKTWGDESLTPMVLVHGYPDNHDTWERIIPHLTESFYVITYDVRGAGRSSIPKKISSYRLAQLANDLESVVNRVIPNRSYHLVAHDWGSIQSWEAVTEPRFKGKLLSYSTISGPSLDHSISYVKTLHKNPLQLLKLLSRSWYIGMFHLPVIAPTFWRLSSGKQWELFLNQLEHQKDLKASPYIATDGQYGINLYRANFIPVFLNTRQRYAQCPVQAIVLKRDTFVSEQYIDEMPKWTEDFSKVTVDGNHWSIQSKSSEIAQHIRDFAAKH